MDGDFLKIMIISNKKITLFHPGNFLPGLATLLFLFFPGKANSAHGEGASEWREISNRDGIQVLSRHVPGSKIIAFRGIVTIDSDIGVIINTINDKSRHPQWVDRLKENKTLRWDSPFDSLEYTRVNCPWPVSDRDFVFDSSAEIDEEKGVVKMHLKSVVDPLMPPRKGVVRAELHKSIYTLTRLGEGRTQVQVEFHGDPKGWVPVWVFNIFQKRWPRATLTNLRNHVMKPEIQKVYSARYNSLRRYYLPQVAESEVQKSKGPLQVSKSN